MALVCDTFDNVLDNYSFNLMDDLCRGVHQLDLDVYSLDVDSLEVPSLDLSSISLDQHQIQNVSDNETEQLNDTSVWDSEDESMLDQEDAASEVITIAESDFSKCVHSTPADLQKEQVLCTPASGDIYGSYCEPQTGSSSKQRALYMQHRQFRRQIYRNVQVPKLCFQ